MRYVILHLKRAWSYFLFGLTLAIQITVCIAATDAESTDELLENISLFTEVLARIQQEHVDTPQAKKLMYGAIKGMLQTLDPYSQFFEPETYKEFQTQTHGTYGGLGMEIGVRNSRLTVISPFKGTPAYRVGMQTDDFISLIDNQPTTNMTAHDAAKKMRGEPGTSVTLTVIREGENEPIEVVIVRDVIRIQSVESYVLDSQIGYLRINQFRDTTALDVDQAFEKFTQQGIKGIILDLRSNPGGLLRSAVEIASDFLPPNQLVVYTKGKQPRKDHLTIEGTQQKLYPLVVLVNRGSASASEIVAAAIKDHQRGLILGERTFGKASVQQIFPLGNDAAVKLTIARYFSPKGTDIHKVGITPNLEDPWFSRTESQMLSRLIDHQSLKSFIESNGDDILVRIETAEDASRDDYQAAGLLRRYRRLSDMLSKEQIILSDEALKYALARETKNEIDDYKYDPQVASAMRQLGLRPLQDVSLSVGSSRSPAEN